MPTPSHMEPVRARPVALGGAAGTSVHRSPPSLHGLRGFRAAPTPDTTGMDMPMVMPMGMGMMCPMPARRDPAASRGG